MHRKHILLLYVISFLGLFSIATSTEEQFVDEFKDKSDGIYFVVSAYKCTACLASLINGVSQQLKDKNINYKVEKIIIQ